MRSLNHILLVAGVCLLVLLPDSPVCAMGQKSSRIFIVDRLVQDAVRDIGETNSTDQIFVLPDTGNPLSIISEKLKQKSWSEIHLYLLTKPGSMIFDELTILNDNVEDNSSHFSEWRKYLPSGAKIIIHSDTLTSVPEGTSLIEKIAELTGATVLVQN